MKKKASISLILIMVLLNTGILLDVESIKANESLDPPAISINIKPNSTIYEGDLVDCNVFGDENRWWWIDRDQDGIQDIGEEKHYTFWDDNPQIFRPEATLAGQDYVNLCVTASNAKGTTTRSVVVKLYKIWYGDYHWHSKICNHATQDYNDVINHTRTDDYLDWLGGCCHIEDCTDAEWAALTAAVNYSRDYSYPGSFCTLLCYEYTGSSYGYKHIPGGHLNVLHKHLDPGVYRSRFSEVKDKPIYQFWDELLYQLHTYETGNNRWAIILPHHSIGPPGPISFQALFNNLTKPTKYLAEQYRLDHLRGAEVLQARGDSIGELTEGFSRIYYDDMPGPNSECYNKSCVDWGVFEASQTYNKGQQRFGFFGGSDFHAVTHLGSAVNSPRHSYVCGITSCWAVHNTREEIFEALNNTDMYASTPLKIRVLAKANGKRFGQWGILDTPVTISISINASSAESNGSAYPYQAELNNADFSHNVTDIWIIKNTEDHTTNTTKAKVIHHKTYTNKTSNIYYEYVYNGSLKPGDYFWIAVDQEEDAIMDNDDDQGNTTESTNKHRAWISPFFVAAVHPPEKLVVNAGASCEGIVNGLIQFHGMATGSTPPYMWQWDFGDENHSDQQNPTHIYVHEGTYNVTLNVTDSNGISNRSTTVCTIEKEDIVPPQVVNILTPGEGLYLNDERTYLLWHIYNNISFLPDFIAIGPTTLGVYAEDDWGISNVEFYINDDLQYIDYSRPFNYKWDGIGFFKQTIKAVAYDNAGNPSSNKIEITVWKLPVFLVIIFVIIFVALIFVIIRYIVIKYRRYRKKN